MSDNRIFSAPHHRHSVHVHGSPNASPINVVLHLPKMCLFLQLFEAASEPMKKWRPLWNWLGHLVSSSSIPNKEACSTRDHPLTPPFVNPLHCILSGPYFNDKSTFPKEKQLCLSIRKLNNAMCIQYYPNPFTPPFMFPGHTSTAITFVENQSHCYVLYSEHKKVFFHIF